MRRRVLRLGHLGDGIADDGSILPGTLPGEEVEEGRILSPSPDRVAPPCPHAGACGGCRLQHASDGFLAAWKVEVVRAALAAQGLAAPFRPIHVSPPGTRRRATLAGRRTKAGVIVGFHGHRSATIVEVPGCRVLHPGLVAALPALEEITRAGASRRGELALSLTRSAAGPDLAVTGGPEPDGPLRLKLAALAARHGLARLAWNGEPLALRAEPFQQFGPARVVPPPGAFLQATEDGEAALAAAVAEAVGPARRLADLFAGCGTFALRLAVRAEVHAVEGEAGMLAALERGARGAPGLRRVTTELRDLFRRPLLPAELARFEAVVIDPPRAGAEAQAAALAASAVPVVAMVSCNPVTFARDARILAAGGFRLDWVQVVDQFRWSPHVELAARLLRDHIPAR